MDFDKLIRSPSKVHADWYKTDDNKIKTREGCKIYVPRRFVEKQLASMSNDIATLGIFAVTVGDKYYGVSLVSAMVRLAPSAINVVSFGDTDYIEYVFEAGDTVMTNTFVMRDDTLPYRIYNEFIAKGHVPWYVSYLDLGKLFDTSLKYANLNLRTNHAILEMLAAVMARDPVVRTDYFRQAIKSSADLTNIKPRYIAFRNIQSQATNTSSKLMGSFFRDALTSALAHPAQRVEGFERQMRM